MVAGPDLRTANVNELEDEPGLLAQVTVLGERGGGLVDAMVPTSLIYREDVPVDETHVRELQDSILSELAMGKGGTGQLSPVLLGEVPGSNKFRIIDGFHRDAALQAMGQPHIYATIRRDSSLEDILDLRILTANTHAAVSFGRVVEWVTDAWQRSGWSEKIDVSQAFGLLQESATGRNLHLDPTEVKQIQAWVTDKCKKWRTSAGTVRANLAIADQVDPILIKEVRRGNRGQTEFTRQHLAAVGDGLPGAERYGLQRLVVQLVKAHELSVPATIALVNKMKTVRTVIEATEIANSQVDWVALRRMVVPPKPRAKTSTTTTRRKTITQPAPEEPVGVGVKSLANTAPDVLTDTNMARQLLLTELQLGRSSLEALVLRGGEYKPPATGSLHQRYLQVIVGADPEVAKLLKPKGVSASLENFKVNSETLTPRLIRILREKHGLNALASQDVVRAAAVQVLEDIEIGDLRFVGVVKESVSYDLLVQCISQQLELRRNKVTFEGRNNQKLSVVGTTDHVTLPNLIHTIPSLDPIIRKMVVMHGLLGASVHSTAVVLGRPANVVVPFLRVAAGKIEHINRQNARLAAAQEAAS